jgi:hypothetical protein
MVAAKSGRAEDGDARTDEMQQAKATKEIDDGTQQQEQLACSRVRSLQQRAIG